MGAAGKRHHNPNHKSHNNHNHSGGSIDPKQDDERNLTTTTCSSIFLHACFRSPVASFDVDRSPPIPIRSAERKAAETRCLPVEQLSEGGTSSCPTMEEVRRVVDQSGG